MSAGPAAIQIPGASGWRSRVGGDRLESLAAALIIAARLIFCVYRAIHQSVTIDEAASYNYFIDGSWAQIYAQYDASNHVLYSILAKLSLQTFGLSELSFRLPSLAAGLFLSWGIFRLLRPTTPRLIRWIAFLALLLHPLLLDFSVAARGYGLSLALLIWAIDFAMQRRYAWCGALLGLAVSANLTIAFAAAGLGLAILLLDDGPWRDRFRNLAVAAAAAETIFFAICFAALKTATRETFYFGVPTISESVRALVIDSFYATRRSGLLEGERLVPLVSYVFLPVAGLVILAMALRKSGGRRPLFPAVTLIGASFALVAGHYAAGLSYPADRTGLYILLLFGIAWAIATARVKWMPVRAVQIGLGLLMAVQFATQLHGRYFRIWQFDMRMNQVAEEIARRSAGKPPNSLSVSATWRNQAALEFYRKKLRIEALKPVRRMDPTEFYGYDFYVLTSNDAAGIEQKPIRVVLSDARSGMVFGVPN